MVEFEVETALKTKDITKIRQIGVTFDKMLQTIACGCQSKSLHVAKLSLKTLKYIALDFRGNIELIKLAMKWFRTSNKGARLIIQAFLNHQDLAQQFLECADAFIQDGEMMAHFYYECLHYYIQDPTTYINTILHISSHLQTKYDKEMN